MNILRFWLENAYLRPFLGAKMYKDRNFLHVYPSGNAVGKAGVDIILIKPRTNRFRGLVLGCEQNLWSQKRKLLNTTRQWYFTHIPGRRNGAIVLNGLWVIITHTKFWGFWSSDTLKSVHLRRIGRSLLQQCRHCHHCRATLWNNNWIDVLLSISDNGCIPNFR